MNIIIKATHHELTEPMRGLIEKKFRVLDKLFRRQGDEAVLVCEVEHSAAIERSGGKYRAEGNLSINGQVFRSESISETLEAAVDEVRDEILMEIRRARGKRRNLLKRGTQALKRMFSFGQPFERRNKGPKHS